MATYFNIKSFFLRPYEFSFLQACYLLKYYKKKYPLFTYSFGQYVHMAPSCAEIPRIRCYPHGQRTCVPVKHFLETPNMHHVVLEVQFLGLIGLQGPLPLIDTEGILRQCQGKNFSSLDFLNIFHHRIVTYYEKIQHKTLLTLNHEKNFYTKSLGHFMASSYISVQKNRSILKYSEIFWHKQDTAWGLKTLLNITFSWNIQRMQYSGGWHDLPAQHHSILGRSVLKRGQTLGQKSWVSYSRIVLWVTANQSYTQYLPGTQQAQSVQNTLKLYGPGHYKIFLRINQTLSCALEHNYILGYTSCLGQQTSNSAWYDKYITFQP